MIYNLITLFRFALIGYDTGKYLILKYPAQAGRNDYSDILVEGNGAIVRYIIEDERGECVAFSTSILAISFRPERLIYLAYPKKIESRQLRETSRLPTHIPAKVSLHKGELDADNKSLLQGLIIDISPSGCRFAIHVSSGFVALRKRQVFVHILSPLDNKPVIISSYIRNNQMRGERLSVGIEFDISEQEKLTKLLEAYSIDID
ncbi:flagellar brake domain-containing protein [Pseudoalteromonas sp. JB197]|uniref:flagellar brake domain-containing protein n=1 Tax=Pseudoalteromonas sp. JB197 TaxID=1434839 RepID=UPI00097EF42B|nr:PilZ domain-containing protein [Pseudoalteromonas sp. JB197]SJN36815.1 predicted glycosyltransferase [Pseudoalteromonas sp. JB197]